MSGSDPAVIAGLAATLLAEMDERGAAVADIVRDRLAFYRESSSVSAEELRRSCIENLRFVLDALSRGVATDPSPAAATGVRRAEAAVPLAIVLAAYRVGFRAIWLQLIEEGQKQGVDPQALLEATTDAMAANELFTDAMTNAYNSALTARIVNQEAERSALVEAVLFGTLTDRRTLWAAADLLRLPLAGPYAVVAAELMAPGRLALPAVEEALAARGLPSAWRLMPDLQVGIVALGETSSASLVAVLGAAAQGRIGLSPTFDGLDTAAQALELARLAIPRRESVGVATFGDDPVGVLTAAAGPVMSRVAADVLAPLHALPESDREVLLETLRAWIDAGGSTTKAATALFCHPNTVRYRLRRVEELVDRRLDRPIDVTALVLALNAGRST